MLLLYASLAATLGRILVGGFFLVAALAKIRAGQQSFFQAVLGFKLLRGRIAITFARLLPWVELIVGSLLIVGLWVRESAAAGFFLLIIFSAAITSSLIRGLDNDCDCLGHSSRVRWRLVFRNSLLSGLLLFVYAFHGGMLTVDHRSRTWHGEFLFEFDKLFLTLLGLWMLSLGATQIMRRLAPSRSAGLRSTTNVNAPTE